MTEIQAARSNSARRPGATAMAVAAVVIVFGGVYLIWHHYQSPPLERYAQALEAIKNHQIPLDESGRVTLSGPFSRVTDHGDAYVTYRDDGSVAVMFPTWYGQGQQVTGLLYTSRPLTDLDMHNRTSAINFDHKLVAAGSYDHLLLDKKINANWYEVSYKVR